MSGRSAAARLALACCLGVATFAPVAEAQDLFPPLRATQPGAASGAAPTTSETRAPAGQAVAGPTGQPPAFAPATPPEAPVQPAECALAAAERRDLGVPAKAALHPGPMHGPTPNQIPGGQLITTEGLVELLRRDDVPTLVFDVLGGAQALPRAIPAVAAHAPGSFDDALQGQFGQYLAQVTQGRKDTPLVFYCLSIECWMSYNAALRAIHLGYANVLWYRGGIEAWQRHGLPLHPPG